MELTIYRLDVFSNIEETFIEKVACLEKPILSICHGTSTTYTFNKYYLYAYRQMIADDTLPYIIRNGEFVWNVPVNEVTIREFLDTHPMCINNGIYVESGYPSAGGLGYIIGQLIWDLTVVYLEENGIELGVGIEMLPLIVNALVEVKDYFASKSTSPTQVLGAVIRLTELNEYEEIGEIQASELLGLDIYHTVAVLIGIGYEKDEVSGRFKLSDIRRHNALSLINMINEYEEHILKNMNVN